MFFFVMIDLNIIAKKLINAILFYDNVRYKAKIIKKETQHNQIKKNINCLKLIAIIAS